MSRFLLERMQRVDRACELSCVNHAIGSTAMLIADFQHACPTKALEHLYIRMSCALTGPVECNGNQFANGERKLFQILLAARDKNQLIH